MGKDNVNTGIEGLDDLLCGGIPKGSTVLIAGPPGAGKTVLSLQYAFSQARKGDRVLFVSTCEPIYKVNKFASSLSFYNLDLISGGINMEFYEPKMKKGYVEFQDYSLGQIVDEQYVGDFFDGIQKKVTRRSIDHLIIDSITSINMLVGDEIERRKKTLLFSAWVSRMGCTTLLTAESDGGVGTERFLADAVIDLGQAEVRAPGREDGLGGMRCRTIEVAKLRGKGHLAGRYLYGISRDGIRIMAPGHAAPGRRGASTGIPDLDAVVGGFAPGDRWHFNAEGGQLFDRMLARMVKEAIAEGEGVALLAPSLGVTDTASAASLFGDCATEALEERRLALACEAAASGKVRDGLFSFSPGKPGGLERLAAEVKTIAGRWPKWRFFLDVTALSGGDAGAVKAALEEVVIPLSYAGATVITFSDASAGPADAIEQHAAGIIDVWRMDMYWLLRVRKAPSAQSFEPFVIKEEDDGIRLVQL